MNILMLILIPVLGLIGFAITTAVKATIEKEYEDWAPLLAQALVRVSCRLHRARSEEWTGELAAAQGDGDTGVVYAVTCLLGSARFAARAFRFGAGRSYKLGLGRLSLGPHARSLRFKILVACSIPLIAPMILASAARAQGCAPG